MRKIDLKDFNNPPAILISASAGRKIRRACDEVNGKVYNGYHYKNDEVRDLLKAYSLGKTTLDHGDDPKCIYCESTFETVGTLQVEHYRPKDGVDKVDNNNVKHPGYYWLGLEWSNLLLSCSKCNGISNKGTRFPVDSVRAIPLNPVRSNNTIDRSFLQVDLSPLTDEKPILINPEITDPDKHLFYNSNAQISFIDESGEKSIEVYGLKRVLLQKARKKALTDYTKEVKIYTIGHKERGVDNQAFIYLVKNKLTEMIKDAFDLKSTYVGWRKFFIKNFITCFLPEVDKDYRLWVLKLYKEVKKQHGI